MKNVTLIILYYLYKKRNFNLFCMSNAWYNCLRGRKYYYDISFEKTSILINGYLFYQ